MEDQVYETDSDYTLKQIKSFSSWCDREIGTEYELNDVGANEHYLMIFDLTHKEVDKIRGFELYFRKAEGLK